MIKEDSRIHIALGFDENYIVPIYALLTSIFYNNRKNAIVFHAIVTGLTEEEKNEITIYVNNNNAEIFYYRISEEYVKSIVFIPENTHFTIATYYRLFFHLLLPADVKKLLYLDSDTIIIGDLRKIFDTEIGNAPIGAVPDSYPDIRYDLGISKKEDYFNAGVLLIDIEKWKEQQVTEKSIRFIADHPQKIKYADQDALNATLYQKWYRLDKGYNVTLFDVSLQVPKKDLVKNKLVIHYTTAQKPWNCLSRNKLRSLYHKYLRLSPKRDKKKYIDFKWSAETIRVFIRIRVKEFYFDNRLDKILPIKGWIKARLDY